MGDISRSDSELDFVIFVGDSGPFVFASMPSLTFINSCGLKSPRAVGKPYSHPIVAKADNLADGSSNYVFIGCSPSHVVAYS